MPDGNAIILTIWVILFVAIVFDPTPDIGPWLYRGRHRGEFPYPLPSGCCIRIKFSMGTIGQGVTHRAHS